MPVLRDRIPTMWTSLLFLLLSARLGRADTCSIIATQTDIEVAYPLDLDYIDEQSKYWSTSCSALKPSCILFPTSASEVSTIIQAINDGDENFAIKSGGHNPNNYYSSVAGGPLISTARLTEAIIDSNNGVLKMGPGNRLDEYAFLPHLLSPHRGFQVLESFLSCLSTFYPLAGTNCSSEIVLLKNFKAQDGPSLADESEIQAPVDLCLVAACHI